MIQAKFQELAAQGEGALVLYVTAGDPSLDQLPEILAFLEESGADLIEVGIPFSDPIADGPTIQASSQRALDRGVTPRQVIDAIQKSQVSIPIITMGYVNNALQLGFEPFAAMLQDAGVSGVILSDLAPEESAEWKSAAIKHGIESVFLVAPTSTDERLRIACSAASGFVYAVSRTGVTGNQSSVGGGLEPFVSRIRKHTELPIAVGFGISSPEHVRSVMESGANGAVVGSWLVNELASGWPGNRQQLGEQIRALKAATRK